jgi:hypothetical protein
MGKQWGLGKVLFDYLRHGWILFRLTNLRKEASAKEIGHVPIEIFVN